MEVEVRTGYDGPFRLWVGSREVLTDPHGINPAVRDAKTVKLKLDEGRHPIAILMALNHGMAWGFFFRMARPGMAMSPTLALPRPC
jgi:sialate O-acetylesterase